MATLAAQIQTQAGLLASVLFAGLIVAGTTIAVLWRWGNKQAQKREQYLDRFVEVAQQSNHALSTVQSELQSQHRIGESVTASLHEQKTEVRRLSEEIRDLRITGAIVPTGRSNG